MLSRSGDPISSAPISSFSLITKPSRILTARKTFPCAKCGGWNTSHNTNTLSTTLMVRWTALLMPSLITLKQLHATSCTLSTITHPLAIASIFEISSDPLFLDNICTGYDHDSWCSCLISEVKSKKLDIKLDITLCNSLLFTGNCLIIPCFKGLREQIFRLAHDNLGHFGGNKMYENLQHEFYWPHMRRDLFQG